MKKSIILILTLLLLLVLPSLLSGGAVAQNGLFSASLEDPSGLCAAVSHYNGFTVIEFAPPNKPMSYQTYEAEMVITDDTIIVTKEEHGYSATYRIRYKFPFSAEADIVFGGWSYTIRDSDTRNSFCNGLQTYFSPNIAPSGTPPPPPPPPPSLTVTARASTTSGAAPLSVAFTATPSKPASIVWKDNGVVFASGPSASIVFANPSTHTVACIATAGNETATAQLTVTVQQPAGGGNGGNNGGN